MKPVASIAEGTLVIYDVFINSIITGNPTIRPNTSNIKAIQKKTLKVYNL